MLLYTLLLLGVIIGSVVTRIIINHKTVYGLYRLESAEDPENPDLYSVKIWITEGQDLRAANKILLKKNTSQE